MNQKSKTLSGSSNQETYIITVENTGQTNSTINLVLEEVSGGGCDNPSSITATLSDSAVTLDTEETEVITVDIEVPEGQQAADYCWEVTEQYQPQILHKMLLIPSSYNLRCPN